MREIKFRGLSVNGKWHYGLVSNPKINLPGGAKKDHWYISNSGGVPMAYEVRPETVTQFAGLQDKNGKDIYEGDRVKRRIHLTEGNDYVDYNCDVKFGTYCYCLFIADKQLWGLDPIVARDIEIIGNVYETPIPSGGDNKIRL